MKDKIVIGIVCAEAHRAMTIIRHLQQRNENRKFILKPITSIDGARGFKYFAIGSRVGHRFLVTKIANFLEERSAIELPLIDETQLDTSKII